MLCMQPNMTTHSKSDVNLHYNWCYIGFNIPNLWDLVIFVVTAY